MTKFLIPLAAAAATLAVATPASAQWAPAPVPYGYGQGYGQAYGAPYGNAYGYHQNSGRSVHQMRRELQQIRFQADQLGRQGRLTRSEARDLYRDLASAERQMNRMGRRGISQREMWSMNDKISRIRYELHRYSDWDRNNRRDRYDYSYRR